MPPPEIIELSDSEPDESMSSAGEINNELLVATTRIELLKKTLSECRAKLRAVEVLEEDVRVAQENLDKEHERKQLLFDRKFFIKDEPRTPRGVQLVGAPPTPSETEVKAASPLPPASPAPEESPLPSHPPCRVKRDLSAETHHDPLPDLYTPGPPLTANGAPRGVQLVGAPPTPSETEVKAASPLPPASPAPEESPPPFHPPCRVKRDPSAETHHDPLPDLYTPGPPPTANGEDAETEPFILAMAKVPLSDKFRDVSHDADTFTRIHISPIVGGQPQGAWPTPDPKKNWRLKIGDYCCFQRELNPFLPTKPGEPGRLYVIREDKLGLGVVYPFFMSEGVGSWMYYGSHEIHSYCQVSLSHWNQTAEVKKAVWCKEILSKEWGKRALLRKNLITEAQSRDWTPKKHWRKVKAFFERPDDTTPNLRLFARIIRPIEYDLRVYNTL
ncbi:hypothetical protein RUND412_006051, partial [Rhizina undulata]